MYHEMNKTDSVMSQMTVAIAFLKCTTVLDFFVAGDVECFYTLDSIFLLWIVVMHPFVTVSDMSQKVITFSYVTLQVV
jgi:hypothetical protein